MDVFEAIEKRHSYRGDFLDKPVPREDLEKIVKCGLHAPSGCNAQTTSFVIVDEPELLKQISDIIGKPFVSQAKTIIVCVLSEQTVYHGKSFAVEDCSAAVENMLLAITALGYATVWLDGVIRLENRAEKIARLLGVPSDKQVRVVLPIGVPAQQCSPNKKKKFSERAWFNKYKLKHCKEE